MDTIMNARVTALEARTAAIEVRLAALEGGGSTKTRSKRELTPEERIAVRQRLLGGQEKKRKEREAAAAAEAKAQPKAKTTKKEAADER